MKLKFAQGLLIMLFVIAIPVFGHLDELPLQLWDESRLAGNALDMYHDGNYLVVHFDGSPEMWSTKPPFMIWMQVLCMKLLGLNELAVRLPSALAALCTCLLIYWMLAKKFGKPWLGIISCAVLITSEGYVKLHGIRTGDYDSMLTLFLTAYSIYFYLYLQEGRGRYLSYSITAIILACLTKGIAGLMMLPALFLYMLYKRKLLSLVKDSRLYVGIAAFIVFVIGYYVLREHYNHGYIQAVRDNELGGRFLKVNEHHEESDYFYFDLLKSLHFQYWYLLLLPGILFGAVSNEKWLRDLTVFLVLLVVSYFYFITVAATKLQWYDLPLYPFLAIIAAIFIYGICILLDGIPVRHIFRYPPLPYALLLLLFYIPYSTILGVALEKKDLRSGDPANDDISEYLKEVLDGRRNIDGCTVTESHPQNLTFYKNVFAYKHIPVTFIHSSDIGAAKKVIAYREDTKAIIAQNYYSHILNTYNNVTEYQIDSVKHK